MLPDKLAIFYKACLIPFVVAFFKIFYQLTWIVGTLKAIRQSFVFDTIFYLAFAAMFRLSFIAIQAPSTWLFMIAMLVTNFAIHSARGKHYGINIFCWHFHNSLSPFRFSTTRQTEIYRSHFR